MEKASEERVNAIVDKLVDVLNAEKLSVEERLSVVSMYFSTEISCAFLSGAIDKNLDPDYVLDGCFDMIRREIKDSIENANGNQFIRLDVIGDC
jgi:hypothetical protein